MAHTNAKAHSKRPIRLAESEFIAVDLCPCGSLQLHFGALTLRLDAAALARLAQTLGLALVRAREAGVAADDAEHGERPWGRPHGDA